MILMRRAIGRVFVGWLLAVALASAASAQTPTGYQTLGVALYNLSNDQITVTWPQYSTTDPNSEIDVYQESVAGQQMLFLGQSLIPIESTQESSGPFLVSIQDSVTGVNLEFSVSATGCQYEPFTWALSNYLAFCHTSSSPDGSLMGGTTLLSYYINTDEMLACIKGNPSSGLDNGLNYSVGVTNTDSPPSSQAFCYQPNSGNNYVPKYLPTMDDSANAFGDNAQYYIALGSYAPTAGPAVSSQAFSGLSPAGVTPCVGSECTIPDNATNWPLTIYYYGTSTGSGGFLPGFQFNSTSTPSSGQGLLLWTSDASVNPWGQGAINVPSYLNNYGNAGSEDTYVPIANNFPDISNVPMPCWPTFNTSGTATCNGEPLYNVTPAPPPSPKTVTNIQDSVNLSFGLFNLFSIF